MDQKYYVYMHVNKCNDKKYIGITSRTPEKRWGYDYNYHHNKHLTSAFDKYGWDGFDHIILFEGLTKEEAERKEVELIAKYKSNQREFGYNIQNGGNLIGKHTDETKNKISEALKGKKLSEETKKKISEHSKGVNVGDKNPNHRVVVQIDKNTNEPIKVFAYIGQACKELGIKGHAHICQVCCGTRNTAGGYKWMYYDDYCFGGD